MAQLYRTQVLLEQTQHDILRELGEAREERDADMERVWRGEA
jgi:hypothetical protein